MRLALPWLDVHAVNTAGDVLTQIAGATRKFSIATTRTTDQVHLRAELGRPDFDLVQRLDRAANIRYQFVWGRVGRAQSVFATTDGSVAEIHHENCQVVLSLSPEVFTAPYSTWRDLVAAPLAEHWRARACYPLHAGAVAFADERLLICGASGSGKTTTALALVAAGATWRSDDKVLVRAARTGVEAVSLYRNTNLPPTTVGHHPSLAFTLDRASIDETNDKRPCDLSELDLPVDLTPFVPTALVFPARRDAAASSLQRLREDEALGRLLEQSPTSACRDRLRGQHEMLVRVARTVPAWGLAAGRDALEAPALFADRVLDVIRRRAEQCR